MSRGHDKKREEKRYKDMMYSEFVKGTGCKENNYNYNIFIKLEDLYMDSNITKEDVYEFGKKLVDNSETEEEKALREEIEREIKEHEEVLTYWEERSKFYLDIMEDKKESKRFSTYAKEEKNKIKMLKWVLA